MCKNEFTALQINLNQNILPQIFPSKRNYNLESNTLIESLFPNKIAYISTALLNGRLVAVTGYMGVGKKLIIQEAFGKPKLWLSLFALSIALFRLFRL